MSAQARLIRLAKALTKGPVTREEVDRIAPSSNGPDYVFRLRRLLKVALPCHRIPSNNKHGERSWYGVYTASQDDVKKLVEFIEHYLRKRGGQ